MIRKGLLSGVAKGFHDNSSPIETRSRAGHGHEDGDWHENPNAMTIEEGPDYYGKQVFVVRNGDGDYIDEFPTRDEAQSFIDNYDPNYSDR